MTTDPTPEPTPVAPPQEDTDPTESLTMRELDVGSRILRYDLLEGSRPGNFMRSAALAVTAYLLARREDPKVKLETFRSMTVEQLMTAMGVADDDQPEDQADDDDALAAQLLDDPVEDQPEPPGPLDDQAALEAEVLARPTEPQPGSLSPGPGESAPPPSQT